VTATASKAETLSIRKILVALDASPQSLAALRAAVELSVKLEAELVGLFVEDIDLLRLADSPYARDLLLPTAKQTPLDRASMERKFKAQAEQVRKAMAAVANQAKVAWSFRVARGSVPSEILMAAAECDLLALGRIGWSFINKSGVGSTALAALSEAVPALLLSSRATFAEHPILVWCDGTPESVRSVLAAAELAQICSGRLTVLLSPSDQGTSNHLREQVVDLLKEMDIEVQYKYFHSSNEAGFRAAVHSERPSVVVLTGTEPFSDKAKLVALLDEMGVSTLFLSQTPFHTGA
jgi:nucleotide-binding universal stress UspA family protein